MHQEVKNYHEICFSEIKYLIDYASIRVLETSEKPDFKRWCLIVYVFKSFKITDYISSNILMVVFIQLYVYFEHVYHVRLR